MRRLKDNAIFILSFIITLVISFISQMLVNNLGFTITVIVATLGLCLMVLSSIKIGGRK